MRILQYIFLISLFLLPLSVRTQSILPDVGVAKYKNNALLVKWQPESVHEWVASMNGGYTIRIIKENIEISQTKVFPQASEDIINKGNNKSPFLRDFYFGSVDFLYPEHEDKNLENEQVLNAKKWDLALLLYSCVYDFELTKMVGLGAEFDNVPNTNYKVIIEVEGFKSRQFDYNPNQKPKPLTTPEVIWGDKNMKANFNTKGLENFYYGYILEKSNDGKNYLKSDSLPYVNNYENFENGEPGYIIPMIDSLEINYRTYYYRIRGMDYFGDWSIDNKTFSGQGYDDLYQSPVIIYADQTEKNYAHLKWKFPEKDERLIKHFVIMRADSMNGEYKICVDSIQKFERELQFPISGLTNYYRIIVLPFHGEIIGSMPVMVMGQDNEPPGKPEVIESTIDKKGNVVIKIKKNMETDLWGYRLLKSNFSSDEFTTMNSSPTLDTIFRDSVELKLGTENIFYIIEAADIRNNISSSDTIRLELPDIIPPAPPIIQELTQMLDTVKIIWLNSASNDVVEQTLYRREIFTEDSWTKILVMDTFYKANEYLDIGLKIGGVYSYTMTAKDDVGLESEAISKKEIKLKESKKEFQAFKNTSFVVSEEGKSVKLHWECNDPEDLESVLIYKGFDENKLDRYSEVKAPGFSFNDNLEEGKIVYYMLKPIYRVKKGLIKRQDLIKVVNEPDF